MRVSPLGEIEKFQKDGEKQNGKEHGRLSQAAWAPNLTLPFPFGGVDVLPKLCVHDFLLGKTEAIAVPTS